MADFSAERLPDSSERRADPFETARLAVVRVFLEIV
jgi:hypothetical protein